ncbi:hypothetical protein, partial [Microbacterium sp. P5_E9]
RAALEELLRDRKQDAAASDATRWPGTVLRWLLIFGLVAALASIFYLGGWLHASGDGKAQQVLSRPMAPERGASASARAPDAPPRADSALRPKLETSVQDVGISATAGAPWPWVPLVLALVIVGGGLGWRWYRRNRTKVFIALGGAIRPVDSGRFMQALRIWNPVVVEHDPTPRHVKRFFNRARLFASYENE